MSIGVGIIPGEGGLFLACSERVQSKVDSANDVADSNVGVNGDNSNNTINSNDEDNESFDSKGGDFGEPIELYPPCTASGYV